MCKWTNRMASLQHKCTINVLLIIYSLSPDFCTWTQWDRLMHELQWDVSGGPKKVAQLLVGHNSKTAQKNYKTSHNIFSTCPKIQCHGYWQYRMCMACNPHGSAWHVAMIKNCQVCPWCQTVIIITVNIRCIAHYSSCSDFHSQQTWISPKGVTGSFLD